LTDFGREKKLSTKNVERNAIDKMIAKEKGMSQKARKPGSKK